MAISAHLKRTQSQISDSHITTNTQTPSKKARACPPRLPGDATVMPAEKQKGNGVDSTHLVASLDALRTPVEKTVDKEAHILPQAPLCVLTRSSQPGIRNTYMIPKDIPQDTMDDLERAWGLPLHTFDFDGPDNTLPLTTELSIKFDAGEWALLPTDDEVLTRLQEVSSGKGKNTDISTVFDVYRAEGKTLFKFAFVPFPGFDADVRRFEDGTSSSPSSVIYRYPYTSVPELTLPLYPHLAIANFMRKYTALKKPEDRKFAIWTLRSIPVTSSIMACEWIWKRWAPIREYPHLPPVDKTLDALIAPADSISCRGGQVPATLDSGVENDKDDDNDELEWQEPRGRFIMRMGLWFAKTQHFKNESPQNHQDFYSSKYTELPPTRPSSPIVFSFDQSSVRSSEDEP